MTDPEAARLIAERVEKLGGKVYFVGGCVRDEILGTENKDIDIEIHGISAEKAEEILDSVGKRQEYGKSFGIYGLSGLDLDIALPRTERKTDCVHGDLTINSDPFMGTYEAARHRDFTVNSLMKDVITGEITDHFGGLDDIRSKTIRHIDDNTFAEDPLRVLRAAQFAARFGFDIAAGTLSLCRNTDISAIAPERIMIETEKALLRSERPSVFFEQLRRMGQLDCWFPEVKALIGVQQNREYHLEGDAWTHTMMVLDEAAKRRSKVIYPLGFMMSALCHDLGKSVCTTVSEDGTVHSYEHETAGLPVVRAFLERITTETKLIDYVLNMTELHMEPNTMARARSRLKKTNKLFDTSAEPFDLIQLALCDGLGKLPKCDDTEEFLMQRYTKFREIMERPFLMGRDLVEAGLKPSKDFSEILCYAHKLRLAGLDKDDQLRQSLAYARAVLKIKG
ncbi:CCA tRNA nucleotidyltransferase [Ruminococcus flavefaciens]|uniref:tRNA nucleotidyltransferase n=1 Tax=Ruminococcus flavefaciens 007c TaxID=1341157 RepID=W7UKU2_RUMFL|nr:CCA tRNA nucleotidyltransferase [Ruminococcus flavefaciens]EWM52179.1 hypothetical protein RF007C_02035 [Ruminococcus flavefaciens 007c]